MRLARRVRALERRQEAAFNAAIERLRAALTPEEQATFVRDFMTQWESEIGHAAKAARPRT